MPTTPAPQPKTRDRILVAALDLFAEKGFGGTAITEIEGRAGLSPGSGSLYRHFPSKEALLRAAVDFEVSRCRAEMEAARAALPVLDDPEEMRAQVYEQLLLDFQRFDRLFRLMLSEGDRVPELREAIWAAVQRPAAKRPTDADAIEALTMSALGGYHLFSMMQGREFNNIGHEHFIRTLVAITEPASAPARKRTPKRSPGPRTRAGATPRRGPAG